MSSNISEYWYEWSSWEVFPEVHYFYKRYKDLLTRFKRVSKVLPKCFQDKELISELDQIREYFETGVKLHVIGTEIDISDLVGSTPEKHDVVKAPAALVHICHTSIHNLDLEGLEDINVLAQKLKKDLSEKLIGESVTFIVCKTENSYSKENIDEFRQAITATILKDTGLTMEPETILLRSEVNTLNARIQEEFKKKLIVGFRRIYACLQNLDLDDKETAVDESNILENETVVKSIREFFRNSYNFTEIQHEIRSKTGEAESDKFIEYVISRFSRLVKCAVVYPLAKKHNLKAWICNELLHEIMFEEALAKSLSENVRFHMKKLEYIGQPTDNQKCYRFDFLLYPIQNDIRPVIVKTEGKLLSMKRLSMTIRRLLSETRGYLKQSKVMEENQSQRENDSAEVSESLRRDILNIEGVYGLGRFYGKLEIHLDKANPPKKNVEEESTEIQDPKFEVVKQMKKHHFHFPYSVRYVQSKPELLNGSFEPGDMLHCQTKSKGEFNKGTLGTFLNSRNGKLYGLTCAHVVAGTKRVFVQKEGRNPLSFSNHVVQTGQDECRLIDIAALEVIPCLQDGCKSSLENNVGRVAKAELENKSPKELVDRYVHKFGAETGLTQGTIMTVDYSTFGPKAEDYIVIIDPLAANNSKELEDLAGAFGSLLEPSPQDGDIHQIEEMETQMIPKEEASGETSTEQAKPLSDVENVNPKRRKLDVEGTGTVAQDPGISNVHESDVRMGDENQVFGDTNVVFEAGVGVLCAGDPNINKGTETIDQRNAKQLDNTTGCTNAILYVRDITESEIEQCQQNESDVFAVEGDSGSAICIRNLSKQGPTYFAVTMLSAGDFEIEGHSGKKALSFMLKDGLSKLYKHCNVEF